MDFRIVISEGSSPVKSAKNVWNASTNKASDLSLRCTRLRLSSRLSDLYLALRVDKSTASGGTRILEFEMTAGILVKPRLFGLMVPWTLGPSERGQPTQFHRRGTGMAARRPIEGNFGQELVFLPGIPLLSRSPVRQQW
jgi:hypothetical protein